MEENILISDTEGRIIPTKEDIVAYGRIVSASTEGVVADAEQIYDSVSNVRQHEVNKKFLAGNYTIGTSNIEDGSVTTDKLNDGAITSDKLSDSSVLVSKISLKVWDKLKDEYLRLDGSNAMQGILNMRDNYIHDVLGISSSRCTIDFGEESYSLSIREREKTFITIESEGEDPCEVNIPNGYVSANGFKVNDSENEGVLMSDGTIGAALNEEDIDKIFNGDDGDINGYVDAYSAHLMVMSIADMIQDECDKYLPKSGDLSFDSKTTMTFSVGSGRTRINGVGVDVWDLGSTDTMTRVSNDLVVSKSFVKHGGTSSDVLMADGSTKTTGAANGIASLDINGFVPIDQLGNLDTQIFLVVEKLPTDLNNIKKNCIYLIPNGSDEEDLNKYKEYIYTGLTDTEFELLHWEKLGDTSIEVDLTDYAKKEYGVKGIKVENVIMNPDIENTPLILSWESASGVNHRADIPEVKLPTIGYDALGVKTVIKTGHPGLMPVSDKEKLNSIESGATKTIVDSELDLSSTNPVQNKIISEALNKKAGTDVVTQSTDGLMSKEDKVKLDSIGNVEQNTTGITFTSSYAESSISSDGITIRKPDTTKFVLTITPEYSASNYITTTWINHVLNPWSITKNYDLVIGNNVPDVYKDTISNADDFSGDGYIRIDSKKSDNTTINKVGNMNIVVPNKTGSLSLSRGNDVNLSKILLSSNKNINITQNRDTTESDVQLTGFNVLLTQSNKRTESLNSYTGTNVNLSNTEFSINNKKISQSEKYFYISHSGDLTDSPNKDEDKIQFFTGITGESEIPLQIKKEEIKCWGDQIKITKGKDVRLKTSSNNSVRLTEGEGFKVFANLYAEPDHAADISNFTDDEKQLLQNNTVLSLLLKIIHYINSKETGAIQ